MPTASNVTCNRFYFGLCRLKETSLLSDIKNPPNNPQSFKSNDNMKRKKKQDLERHRNPPNNAQSCQSNHILKKKGTDLELKNSASFRKHQILSKGTEYRCHGNVKRTVFFMVPNYRESCKEVLTSEANKLFAIVE